MGKHDLGTSSLKGAAVNNSSRILVVAAPENLDVLAHGGGTELLPGLVFAPHGPAQEVSTASFANISLAVIEVDPHDPGSMQRLSAIRARHPDVALVAAINGASLSLVRTLVREGISDVVALPFDLAELLQVTLGVAAKRSAPAEADAGLAPLVAVARSIGGCGATSLATHLAADFAANDASGRGAVIVDLDLQFGSVADYLGVRARGSIADLLEAHERLDEDLLRSVVAESAGGVSVIAAPDAIMPLESVDSDDLLRLIRLLRQHFAYVVLDLPANWTSWTLSAALKADAVVLVVELSIASLRQAKRRLELFRSVGIEDRDVKIVVNRVEQRLFRTIDLGDVSDTLNHPVLGSIALDAPLVGTAQNQGMLVSQLQRKSRFLKDIAKVGAELRSSALARRR